MMIGCTLQSVADVLFAPSTTKIFERKVHSTSHHSSKKPIPEQEKSHSKQNIAAAKEGGSSGYTLTAEQQDKGNCQIQKSTGRRFEKAIKRCLSNKQAKVDSWQRSA